MAKDAQRAAVVGSLKATASELHARAHEDMNDDWADRMAEALAAAGLLATPAPLTDDQHWQWRASMIADLSGMDEVWDDVIGDLPDARAYFEAIADGLLKAGWRFGCASPAAPAPATLDLQALAVVCEQYVYAWRTMESSTVLGSLALRVAEIAAPAVSPAAPAQSMPQGEVPVRPDSHEIPGAWATPGLAGDTRHARARIAAMVDRFSDVSDLMVSVADLRALVASPAAPAEPKIDRTRLREIAEVYLYDGDTDRPLPGYNELLDAAGGHDDNPPAAPADDEALKRLERKLDTLRAIAQGVSSGADDMRKEIDNVTRRSCGSEGGEAAVSDDDTAFDNWAHDNVIEPIYARGHAWPESTIPRPSDVRELLRKAFVAGIEHLQSQLPTMPW